MNKDAWILEAYEVLQAGVELMPLELLRKWQGIRMVIESAPIEGITDRVKEILEKYEASSSPILHHAGRYFSYANKDGTATIYESPKELTGDLYEDMASQIGECEPWEHSIYIVDALNEQDKSVNQPIDMKG